MAKHPDIRIDDTVRPQDITHLWEQHNEILRMLVLGYKPKELAAMFNVSEGFISNLRNSPLAAAQLEILNVARDAATVEVSRDLVATAPAAKDILKNVILGNIDASLNQQIETAKDWLSRSGFPKLTKTETSTKHGLDAETVSMLKSRAEEAAKDAAEHSVAADFTVEENAS